MPTLGENIRGAVAGAQPSDPDAMILMAIMQVLAQAGKGVQEYFETQRSIQRHGWAEAEERRGEKGRLAERMAYGQGKASPGEISAWNKALASDQELSMMFEQSKRAREMQELNLASTKMNYEAATKAQKEASILDRLKEGTLKREEAITQSKSAVAQYDKWVGAKEQTIQEKIKAAAEKSETAISFVKRNPIATAEDLVSSYALPGLEWSDYANRIIQDSEDYDKGVSEAVKQFKRVAKEHPELFSHYVSDAFSTLGEKAGILDTKGIQSMLSDDFEKTYVDEGRSLDALDTVMYKLAKDPETKSLFQDQFKKAFLEKPSALTMLYGGRRMPNVPVLAEQAVSEANFSETISPYIEKRRREDVGFGEEFSRRRWQIDSQFPIMSGGKKTVEIERKIDKREQPLGRELKVIERTAPKIDLKAIERKKQLNVEMQREFYLEAILKQLADAQVDAQEELKQNEYWKKNLKRPQ